MKCPSVSPVFRLNAVRVCGLDSLAENEDEQRHEGQVDEVHTFDQCDRQEEDRLEPALGLRLARHALDVRRTGETVTHAGADSTTGEGQSAAHEGTRGLDGGFDVSCHCFSLVVRRPAAQWL